MIPMRSRAFVQTMAVLSLALTAGVLSERAAAGPLSPPSGVVTSTGKTLREVAPETAITPPTNPTSFAAMIRISQSGNYYLTGDLVISTPGFAGIEITANDVTLDMRGFRIVGIPGSTLGIGGSETASGFKLRNGTITNTGGIGIGLGFADNVVVENVRVQYAAASAIVLGPGAKVNNCQVFSCQSGITVEAGSAISNCTVRNTSGVGFTTRLGCKITNSIAIGNLTGFLLGQGSSAESCTATTNTGVGFQSNSLAVFNRCVARSNGTHGFDVGQGSHVLASYAATNGSDGFRIDRATRITDCQSFTNGTSGTGAGIRALSSGNTIEGNSVNDNPVGISIEGSPNLYIRNTAVGSSQFNFSVANGNRGNVVPAAAAAAFQGDQGGAAVSTDPNANITY